MEGAKGKTRQTRFRASYVLLIVCLVLFLGAHVYAYVRDWRYAESVKADARSAKPLIDALWAFHDRHGTFPTSLEEIRPALPASLLISSDGRSFISHHYFYLYSRTGEHVCSIWMLPPSDSTGRDASSMDAIKIAINKDSPSFFLAVYPRARRKFQRDSPLPDNLLGSLKPAPTLDELNARGFQPVDEPNGSTQSSAQSFFQRSSRKMR